MVDHTQRQYDFTKLSKSITPITNQQTKTQYHFCVISGNNTLSESNHDGTPEKTKLKNILESNCSILLKISRS